MTSRTAHSAATRRVALPRALVRGTLLVLLAAAGCTSPAKRLERAERHGFEGRWADAVEEYIEVLRKDRTYAGAQERLRIAADSMMSDALRRSAAHDAAGRPAAGADLLLQADALRGRAAQVGVNAALPADYGEYRRRLMDGAIDEMHQLARADEAAGQWSRALGRYTRAAEQYQPSPLQRTTLDSARFATQVHWAESDARQGRYRAAHERLGRALAMAGAAGPEVRASVTRLQSGYAERGTRTVAFLPACSRDAAARTLPEELLPSLNDELVHEQWTRPPLFLAAVPAAELSREVRRLGYTRGTISTADAARLGSSVRAHLIVTLEADTLRRTERDVRTTRRTVKTRAGADTAFVIEHGRATVELAVRYMIVEPASRREVDRGTVRTRVASDFRRPRYEGDWRQLELARSDLDLFRRQERDDDGRALVQQLAGDAARRIAEEVWQRLLQRVE
jgi:tetratricopeptide (TPR) repeat protein